MCGNLISDPMEHFSKLISVRKILFYRPCKVVKIIITVLKIYLVISGGFKWHALCLNIVEKLHTYLVSSRGGTRTRSGRKLLLPQSLVSKEKKKINNEKMGSRRALQTLYSCRCSCQYRVLRFLLVKKLSVAIKTAHAHYRDQGP